MPRTSPIRVAVLAFDGCLTSAVTSLVDALHIASFWSHELGRGAADSFAPEVRAAAPTITGSSGFVLPAVLLDREPRPDIAIVPPITGPIEAALAANPAILAWLADPGDTIVASVCTGAFFLAEAGLLAGRRATTHAGYADAFRRAYGDVELTPEARLVDAGRVLSAGTTTAFLDLAIYLVDRFIGHEVAVLTAKSLSMDKNHHSQLPYFLYVAPKDHGDEAVLRLQEWIEEHFAEAVTGPDLARRGAMSERSLHRRFRAATGLAPHAYLHNVRIEAAKRLLETSHLSVDQITGEIGYEDARSFSRLFRSRAGQSPGEYRKRFGLGGA